MAKKDWEVGPVLKEKAGSQGTLFRGGTKYSSDARYPKGYTPERLAEVRPAIQGSSRLNFHDDPYRTGVPGTGPARRRLVDTVARSTVPAEHLSSVQFNPGQAALGSGLENAAGVYHRGTRTPPSGSISDIKGKPDVVTPAKISILAGHEETTTAIHEIGHHASALADNDWRKSGLPQAKGMEEGFADRYAFEHYRDRRGKPLTELRVYPKDHYYPGDASRSDAFSSGYHAVRGDIPGDNWHHKYLHNPTPFMQAKEAESRGETLFTTWDNGDGTVGLHAPREKPHSIGERIGWSKKGQAS